MTEAATQWTGFYMISASVMKGLKLICGNSEYFMKAYKIFAKPDIPKTILTLHDVDRKA